MLASRLMSKSHNKAAFYEPEMELSMIAVKQDLTRSVIVTILALILQFSFAWWLNAKNGWQIVNSIIK